MPKKQQLRAQEAAASAEKGGEEDAASAMVASGRRRGGKRARSRAARAPSVSSSIREARTSSIANYPVHSPSGFRLKRAFLVGRRGGPSTPVPSWKVFDNPFADAMAAVAAEQQQHVGRPHVVSARTLAATLWELQEVPFSRGGAHKSQEIQRPQQQQPQHHLQRNKLSNAKRLILHGQFLSPASSRISQGSHRRPPIQYKIEAAGRVVTPSSSVLDMKTLAKDRSMGPTTTSDLLKVLNHVWSLEEQHTSSMSMVNELRAELDHVRSQMQELMLHEKSHHKEIENMTRRISEEKALWQEQQQETIRLAVQSIREELEDERKAKQRLETLQRRAAKNLHEVKRTLGKALQDLGKERKARELMEDVCDELAREIGDDKARVEQLKRESVKVREEVEEERKMLQMAEIWREERVQMKLMEAKLELEEKNAALDKLRGELEAFLKAKRAGDFKDEGNGGSADAWRESRRHSVDAIVGRNLADSFHSKESRVPGRNSVDSLCGNEGRPSARRMQELDDDGSVDDDDLHSIELNNESFLNPLSGQWGRHSFELQESEFRGRRSTDQKVINMEKLKQRQAGKSQGLGRTRSSSSQFDSGVRGQERRRKDIHQDYMQDLHWIEQSIEKSEMTEWSHDRVLKGGREEINKSWQSDNEDSHGHVSSSPKVLGRNVQGHVKVGGILSESAVPHYEENANLELSESANLELSEGSATWRHQAVGSSRDMRGKSGFAPVYQLSHAASSPTRQWNYYWSSPETGSPHQGKGSKGSSEMSKGLRDNSLKAKLLEAKLEGQQGRLRGGKNL